MVKMNRINLKSIPSGIDLDILSSQCSRGKKKELLCVILGYVQKHSLTFLYIALHLRPNDCLITRKIPHIPDSTSHAKLPER